MLLMVPEEGAAAAVMMNLEAARVDTLASAVLSIVIE
jgi:hypothetical protein